MTSAAAKMPEAGDVLLGRFRLESVIGEGGMGLVYRARELPGGQAVAVKILLAEASVHPEAIPRFLNEARATMKLASPHVVKIVETGTLESGLPCIVMELLEGNDLKAIVEKQGGLPVTDAVDWVIEATDALAEAHALGIVHRDLKPSNLFLASRPDGPPMVKVLDFGVSKMSGPGGANQALTATGAFLGSPHYMPPEQLKSARDVDARADIYALGIILYELFSTQLPFDGGAFGEVFLKVLQGEYKPLRTLRPDVPTGIEEIIARCLKRARDERFQNLAEFAQALVPFASAHGARVAAGVGQAKGAARPPERSAKSALGSTMLLNDPRVQRGSSPWAAAPPAREANPHPSSPWAAAPVRESNPNASAPWPAQHAGRESNPTFGPASSGEQVTAVGRRNDEPRARTEPASENEVPTMARGFQMTPRMNAWGPPQQQQQPYAMGPGGSIGPGMGPGGSIGPGMGPGGSIGPGMAPAGMPRPPMNNPHAAHMAGPHVAQMPAHMTGALAAQHAPPQQHPHYPMPPASPAVAPPDAPARSSTALFVLLIVGVVVVAAVGVFFALKALHAPTESTEVPAADAAAAVAPASAAAPVESASAVASATPVAEPPTSATPSASAALSASTAPAATTPRPRTTSTPHAPPTASSSILNKRK